MTSWLRLPTDSAEDRKTRTRHTQQRSRGTGIRCIWNRECTGGLGQRPQERHENCSIQQPINNLLLHIVKVFLNCSNRTELLIERANNALKAKTVPKLDKHSDLLVTSL